MMWRRKPPVCGRLLVEAIAMDPPLLDEESTGSIKMGAERLVDSQEGLEDDFPPPKYTCNPEDLPRKAFDNLEEIDNYCRFLIRRFRLKNKWIELPSQTGSVKLGVEPVSYTHLKLP